MVRIWCMVCIMRRWHIVVPDELAVRVDGHLDGRNLSAFVRRAVEHALDGGDGHRASRRAEQPPLKQGPPQTFPPVPADPIVIDPEPPRGARAVSQPGPDVSRIRSSAQVQRSGPIVKGGKK